MENNGTVTVSMTVSVNGAISKTFTSNGETTGDPRYLAEQLTFAVRRDASEWIGDLRQTQIDQPAELDELTHL